MVSGSPGFTLGDIAGSVGNFGTVLPLFFAISITTGLSLQLMLLLCGLWYIVCGVVYQVPIPVEPLKAIAAVAIAGQATSGEIAASGIMMGFFFLILGFSGGVKWLQDKIATAVIRGIQFGLGLILLRSAILTFGIQDLFFFSLCSCILLLFIAIRTVHSVPDLSAISILCLGILIMIQIDGFPSVVIPSFPSLMIPSVSDFWGAFFPLFIPQIPLTLANAILATSLLVSDLYHKPVSPGRLSCFIGLMSLSSSVLGGFPMCHGAGGVAAHYRFGARHGSAMIIGGTILILFSSFMSDPVSLSAIPQGVFGALLLAVSLEMISHGIKTDNYFITGFMAILSIFSGIAFAFIGGIILSSLFRKRHLYGRLGRQS